MAGLGGYDPTGNASKGAPGMFGEGPMDRVRDTLGWGQKGLFVSRGPQDTQWAPGQSWNQINTPTGINGALFGSSYGQGFGQGAYERFQDSGDSYLRRFGTDLVVDRQGNSVLPFLDAQGNQVGYGQGGVRANPAYSDPNNLQGYSPERGAGARSMSTFGGRNSFNDPLTGSEYDTHTAFSGLTALQQGANPYLNDPTLGAAKVRQNELDSPFARADPSAYLNWSRYSDSLNPTTADVGNSYVRPTFELGGESVDKMRGMTNTYEDVLMQQLAREGSKDLSLGLQDAQSTMAAMGLGRSGAGQGTAAGVWRDIQERNAADRSGLMAQFREGAMNRQAEAIMGQQQGGINAALAAQQLGGMGSESRLQRGNAATMAGLDALTGSLEASRAADRQALGGGLDRTLQWNLGSQGNYLQSLLGGDQAALNRMTAEANAQSQGMRDYAFLQDTKDRMRTDRLNEMLGLEDRYRTSQNEVLNQMRQYGMLPLDYMMQAITGIQTGGVGQSRTSPWGPMLAQAGLNYGGDLLNQMGRAQLFPGYGGANEERQV